MSADDRAWTQRSFAAWRDMELRRLALSPDGPTTIILFDAGCRFETSNAQPTSYVGTPHEGEVRLPDGAAIPAAVTSFAGTDEASGQRFFVMALPSVWLAAKVPIVSKPDGLTGVFLHEFSHVRQTAALKPAFDRANAIRPMPDDINDDSVQQRFGADPAYRAAMEKEMTLLQQASTDPDAARARKLAREALALIDARQTRWFTGEDALYKNYEDIFLTMEGFGQWVAFAWLSDPKGGAQPRAAAEDLMRGGRKWWSQEEGLSLMMVVDRFVTDWPQRAFAENPALAIDLLRAAVTDPDQR